MTAAALEALLLAAHARGEVVLYLPRVGFMAVRPPGGVK
jgi:hypothetical protein